MGPCWSDEADEQVQREELRDQQDVLRAALDHFATLVPEAAATEDLGYLPSRLGVLGVWKIDVLNENYVVEINDDTATLRPLGLVIPIMSTIRELREEDEGQWSMFMGLTFYQPTDVPDAWRNNNEAGLLIDIKISQRCSWDADVNGWTNSLDTVNVGFQLNEDIEPIDTQARRNSNSDKLNKLRDAKSFKKGDSPRSYIYGGGSETTECPLCYEDFDDDKHMAVVTKCKHVWCSSCIIAVCKLAPPDNIGECPTCRVPVRLEDMKRR